MNQSLKDKQKAIIAGVAALAVTVVAGAVISGSSKKQDNVASANTTTQATTSNTTTADASTATYKDGSYMATGTYDSPGGNEKIIINVTLKDGTIADTSAQTTSDGESLVYQNLFVGSYKSQVVGKAISTLKLGRVSGSSLTPIGFNNAIKQIKDQAKA